MLCVFWQLALSKGIDVYCGVKNMAEELLVTLTRGSDTTGFGFSLLGTAGLPHVIYDIVENSPAAECEKVIIIILFL